MSILHNVLVGLGIAALVALLMLPSYYTWRLGGRSDD